MEKLHFNMVLFPLFLLQFPYLLFLSSAYTLQDKYFINCGSNSNITVSGRNFLGDLNSGSSFYVGPSVTVTNAESSTYMSLYQTARIFSKPCSYEFDIIDKGIYYVRIHFFPFMSPTTNLADAVFNVSVSRFSLLSNFSIPSSSSNSPVIKEFLLNINGSKFSVYFTPKSKSFAFVNAIEVFLTPENFGEDNFTRVTPFESNDSYVGVRSQVLHTIHRINVGGPQNNDTLWRNWIPDDGYLLSVGSAKNCVSYNGRLNYDVMGATNYSASDLVYKTCKELNLDSSTGSSSSNITWRFNVSKNVRHLVRLHFCDIISTQPDLLKFNLYIYGVFIEKVDPYYGIIIDRRNGNIDPNNVTNRLAAPFYDEFVVDSDDSGFMNISVGSRGDSANKTAYLNGLEITEFMKELDMVPMHGEPKKLLFVIVGSVGGVVLFFILVMLFLLGLKWKKAKQVDGVGSLPMLLLGHGHGKGTANVSHARKLNLNLKIPLVDILEATDNFDIKLLVGEGGFGKVYKGSLPSGIKVAVKRSDPKHGQGLQEFETEIIVLSKIRHRHLVSLIGYCDEGSEMILVYEFMEKGTLRDHLYNANENSDFERTRTVLKLSWKQRLEICIASAKGLHYLHTCSHGGIIHRDVKSTNILLNEDLVAKVADFGLSTPGPLDPDHFSVGIKGSFGYLDPEYFRTFQFTEKSDVYSFGVVLLEVLCARSAIIDSTMREEVNLADWGMFWQKKGQLEKIIDPLLVDEINPDSLRKFGETAERCLKGNGDERPTMLDVQWDLEYALQLQKTAVNREPLEDSTTNAFLELPLPPLWRLPFNSILNVEDDEHGPLKGDGDLDTTDRAVFSQMGVDGAR